MIAIIIKSISMQKAKLIPIIIQFVIGLCAAFICCFITNVQKRDIKMLSALFPNDAVHLYSNQAVWDYQSFESEAGQNRYYCDSILGKKLTASGTSGVGLVQQFSMIEPRSTDKTMCLMVNDDFLQISSLGIIYPELYTFGKPDSEYIPAVVGYGLKDSYVPGEEYSFSFSCDGVSKIINLKIIAVQDKDQIMIAGNSSMAVDTCVSDQRYLIIPSIVQFDNIAYTNNLFIPVDTENVNRSAEICELFATEGIVLNSRRISEEITAVKNRQKPFIIATAMFAGIILFLSSIGFIGTLLSALSLRTKELGIRYALGMRKKQLALMVISEILFVFIISCAIALLLSIILMLGPFSEIRFTMSLSAVYGGLSVIILCCALCSVIPVNLILKSEPVTLLNNSRGNKI